MEKKEINLIDKMCQKYMYLAYLQGTHGEGEDLESGCNHREQIKVRLEINKIKEELEELNK